MIYVPLSEIATFFGHSLLDFILGLYSNPQRRIALQSPTALYCAKRLARKSRDSNNAYKAI